MQVSVNYLSERSASTNRPLPYLRSFATWLVLNDRHELSGDFLRNENGITYTCKLFETSDEDSQRFDKVFSFRISFTKSIHDKIKLWVAANIERDIVGVVPQA